MSLSRDRISEILKACADRKANNPEYEIMRGYCGELLDELSVAGSIIGTWTAREMERHRGDKAKVETLNFTRSYAERLLRGASGGMRR